MTTVDAKTCQKQVGEGSSCKADFDCVNSYGCNNNTCVAYFSLADGSVLSNSALNKWSLCASGESSANVCRTRTNANDASSPCDSDCTYINGDGTNTTDAKSCLCSMSTSGKRYCKLANGHAKYKDWVAKQKAVIKSDVANCHSLERDRCAWSKKNNNGWQSTKNAEIEVKSWAEFVDIQSCVREITFPEWVSGNTPVDTKQCPKYTCDSSIKNCAEMKFVKEVKQATLNGCTNSTKECLVTENMVLDAVAAFNVSCSEKTDMTTTR